MNDGAMSGFADDLRASEPQLAAQLTTLDDQQAEIEAPQVGCVSVALPTGAPGEC
jgi:hypothetical protein